LPPPLNPDLPVVLLLCIFHWSSLSCRSYWWSALSTGSLHAF